MKPESGSNRIEEFIKTLSRSELVYLNRLVVERVKLLDQARSTEQLSRFNLGEKVQFSDADGNLLTGRIIRLNKKTVSLLTDGNQRWNVAPALLRKA